MSYDPDPEFDGARAAALKIGKDIEGLTIAAAGYSLFIVTCALDDMSPKGGLKRGDVIDTMIAALMAKRREGFKN